MASVDPPRRVRKSPSARRAELVATAREVFAAGGPADAGVADVASAANVSKGLLYHYFPAGRSDLVDAVGAQLVEELTERVAAAAAVPFSDIARLEQVLAAIFAYFDDTPVAYQVLFVVPGDDETGPRHHVRAWLTGELTSLLAGSGVPVDELLAASAGLLGFVLANVELCLTGLLDAESAWRASCRCARALLST